MRTTSRTIAALIVATALVATPAVASAQTANETPPVTLAGIQASAATLIDGRLQALDTAAAAATSSTFLTEAHRSAILASLSTDSSGLEALRSAVAADTDRASAASHWAQIFTEYRVYAVVVPQSSYAAAADALTESALPALEKSYTALAAALAISPKSTPELEATLADMRQQLDTAQREAAGVADAVLAVTPAAWNADHSALVAERTALATATQAAAAAADDAATIVGALQ